jgi:hypothetical protein
LGGYFYIGTLLLVVFGVLIGLGLLFYFVPKNLGYPRTSKYLTIIYGLFVLTVTTLIVFDEQFFTKNDARKLIEEQEFIMTDEFKLENYKSASVFDDFYNTFTLKISEKDRLKAIEQVKNSDNFKNLGEPITNFLFYDNQDRYIGQEKTQNYETEKEYVREYFKPNGQGYAPTFKRISIDKKENKLTFEEY